MNVKLFQQKLLKLKDKVIKSGGKTTSESTKTVSKGLNIYVAGVPEEEEKGIK